MWSFHSTARYGLMHKGSSQGVRRPFSASKHPPQRQAQCRALLGLDRIFKGSSAAPSPQQPLYNDEPDLEPEFQAWLRQQGVSTQPLLLRQCGREGRGLVADRPLPRGELLLQVPDSLLITAERAAAESCLAPILPRGPQQLPEWSLLALYLAELRGRAAAGERSARWAAYVGVLPQRPGTVLDWPAKEAKQLLRGSPLLRLADSITAAAASSLVELEPLVAQGRTDGLLPAHVPLARADLEWAFGILLSRCIRLAGRGQMQVLAPWADLLNHDVAAGEGCHLDWEPAACGGAGGLVLRADRQYVAGQQVYVSYGPKSSGELLLSYGFCPPPAANPHQDFKLRLAVDSGGADPLAALKREALARHGLPPEMEFPLKLEGIPEGLLQYLALLEARPKVAQETFDLASLLFESGTFPLLDGQDTLVSALRALAARCGAALKEYPTSLEVDQALAAGGVAAVANRPPPGRRRAPAPTAASRAPPAAPPAPPPSAPGPLAGSGGPGGRAADGASLAGVTLGTDDVAISAVRAAAVGGIRVRERQILQRTQAAANSQLVEVKRAERRR